MYFRTIRLKSILMAAVAGALIQACNKDGTETKGNDKDGSKDVSERGQAEESPSQGTGYGGQGTGTGGAGTGHVPDRTEAIDEADSDFVRSFYGPPGSDWRFTPGTGLYNFPQQRFGGTGLATPPGSDPAAPDKTKSADTSVVPGSPAD